MTSLIRRRDRSARVVAAVSLLATAGSVATTLTLAAALTPEPGAGGAATVAAPSSAQEDGALAIRPPATAPSAAPPDRPDRSSRSGRSGDQRQSRRDRPAPQQQLPETSGS